MTQLDGVSSPSCPDFPLSSSSCVGGWGLRVCLCCLAVILGLYLTVIRVKILILSALLRNWETAWVRVHTSEESARNDAELGTSQLGVGDRSKPQLPGFLGQGDRGSSLQQNTRDWTWAIKQWVNKWLFCEERALLFCVEFPAFPSMVQGARCHLFALWNGAREIGTPGLGIMGWSQLYIHTSEGRTEILW